MRRIAGLIPLIRASVRPSHPSSRQWAQQSNPFPPAGSWSSSYATATRVRKLPEDKEEGGDDKGKEGSQEKERRRRRWPVLLIPIPVLSYLEIRRLKNPAFAKLSDIEVTCYRLLPWRTVSRTWGFVNSIYLPEFARMPILSWYASAFGCLLEEAEQEDLRAYKNLGDFFRRSLKPGLRPICPESSVVSPADGVVLHFGSVSASGMVEQVKGVNYSLQEFLGPKKWLNEPPYLIPDEEYAASLMHNPKDNDLYSCVIYLAPGDYHRFHSPASWNITHRRHFPGELLSVNPRMARWISGLFTLNERVVYSGEWEHGFFSMTAVGATNVGSIRVYSDPELQTNSLFKGQLWKDRTFLHSPQKGDPFGEFNLGSTIVLIFEAPKGKSPELKGRIHVGKSILL